MRNVERHAGATRVTMSLRTPRSGHGLTLTIADDGVGFDVQAARIRGITASRVCASRHN